MLKALSLLGLLGLGACGWLGDGAPSDDLEPDTARFTYGDRSVEVTLTSCGRDGDVVLAAGRQGAVVLQVAADLGDDGAERTGVTADLGPGGIRGAFGGDLEEGPAGEIGDVRVEGDRLIVEGTWAALDSELQPTETPSEGVDGEVRVRCPEDDDGDDTAAPTVGPRQ